MATNVDQGGVRTPDLRSKQTEALITQGLGIVYLTIAFVLATDLKSEYENSPKNREVNREKNHWLNREKVKSKYVRE